MTESNIQAPGVYINEINAFPNSVVAIPTAIPAFIGYTPQALSEGKSLTNVAFKINSFSEFQTFFCKAEEVTQYKPQYYPVLLDSKPSDGDFVAIDGKFYSVLPDPNTMYYLYNSIRLFYLNGGGTAYIVSVGGFGPQSNTPAKTGEQFVNPNVKLNELLSGLELLASIAEVTMYICPESTLLSVDDNATLMQSMFRQSNATQSAISIFDVIGGRNPDPVSFNTDIALFRSNSGIIGLSYGTAYYPFLGTSIMQPNEIDYNNLFGGSVSLLGKLLSPADNPNAKADAVIAEMQNPDNVQSTTQLHNALLASSPAYKVMVQRVQTLANILPPSGAIAGIITMVDSKSGPWQAPANVSIVGATIPMLRITDAQQSNLNEDAVTGKSVNAIRFFNGMGIQVWGARTMDGNSQDWRYISVRRTLIMLEQSIKAATLAYVFAPNDAGTWTTVQSQISNFLAGIWQQGGLAGSIQEEAFSVSVGLGSTMTAQDILDGMMKITVLVAVTHPAEFIEITFQQQMQKS